MDKIKRVLSQHPRDHDVGSLLHSIFWISAMQGTFDSETHLSLADVAVHSKLAPTIVQIIIKQSKTDPFRQGVQLYL